MAERVFFGSVGGVARGKGLKGRGAEGRVLPWRLKWRGGGAVGCLEGGVACWVRVGEKRAGSSKRRALLREWPPVVKNPPATSGDVKRRGFDPWVGKIPNPLQYSHLESPMDRGDWWATAQGVAKRRTGLKREEC